MRRAQRQMLQGHRKSEPMGSRHYGCRACGHHRTFQKKVGGYSKYKMDIKSPSRFSPHPSQWLTSPQPLASNLTRVLWPRGLGFGTIIDFPNHVRNSGGKISKMKHANGAYHILP